MKIKPKLIVFSLLSFMILVSCKKERTIHITAKNAATGAPYPGLTYYVVTEKSINGGAKSKTVATGVLDENGEAYFTKRLSNEWGQSIRVEEPENTCYNKNIQLSFGTETNFEANFEFAECAYMKLSIHNVNFQGLNDYFKLYYLGRQVGGQGNNIVGAIIKEGGGNYSYVGSDFSSVPMGERYYKWEVTRNNITTIYYDTIYLNKGEYKTYTINY